MNRMLKVLLPGVLLAMAVAVPARADIKIGVVNYQRLAQGSPQAKAAQDALQADFAPRQRELATLQGQLKAKEDKLQKDAATMSESQRSNAEKELRDGYRDLQRKQQEAQEGVQRREPARTKKATAGRRACSPFGGAARPPRRLPAACLAPARVRAPARATLRILGFGG